MNTKKSYTEPANRLWAHEIMDVDGGRSKTKYLIRRSYGRQGSVEESLAKLALREKK